MIPVTRGGRQRSSQNEVWAAPLTKSYPQSTFLVTASNGAPLSPGQSPQPRTIGTSTSDPRSAGAGFTSYNLGSSAQNLSNLIAPRYTGGNSYTTGDASSMGTVLGFAALAVLAVFLLFKK